MSGTHIEEREVQWATITSLDNQRCVVVVSDQEYLTGIISYLWMNERVKQLASERPESMVLFVRSLRDDFVIGESAGILRHEFALVHGYLSIRTMTMSPWHEHDYTTIEEIWSLDGAWIGGSNNFETNMQKWPDIQG